MTSNFTLTLWGGLTLYETPEFTPTLYKETPDFTLTLWGGLTLYETPEFTPTLYKETPDFSLTLSGLYTHPVKENLTLHSPCGGVSLCMRHLNLLPPCTKRHLTFHSPCRDFTLTL